MYFEATAKLFAKDIKMTNIKQEVFSGRKRSNMKLLDIRDQLRKKIYINLTTRGKTLLLIEADGDIETPEESRHNLGNKGKSEHKGKVFETK